MKLDQSADPVFAGASELAGIMRAKDWSATSLGAPSSWPLSLRTLVRMMLTSRFDMWMGWGPDLSFFYNDAYRPTLAEKHPDALGRPAYEVWAEIWPAIGPRIEQVLATGEATWDAGLLLFLERRGYPEETYHTFSYSPVVDDAGVIAGMLCVVTEETDRVIGERRLALLRDLAAQLTAATRSSEVTAAIEAALTREPRDAPFSLTYLIEHGVPRLVARTSMAEGHPAAAPVASLEALLARWGAAPELGSPQVVDLDAGGDWPCGPWPAAPNRALLLPVSQAGHAEPAGLMIVGLNPHRPFDDSYREFLGLLAGQVSAALATARAHEAERERARALAELDRQKTQFFSNVSHELRTPLTLLLGPLEEVRADPALSPDLQGRLDVAHRNASRLLKLVNGLLDFARIEAGRMQATFRPTDVARLTGELASMFESVMRQGGVTYRIDIEPIEDVYLDADLWEKIVLNLLSNAFKFTLAGSVEVSLRRHGGHARLEVRDTGAGIGPEDLPRIFERFHRVEGVAGRSFEGTGIGLALVQELVALHGGRVAVQSELGRGTTFTVDIPVGREHLPDDRVLSTRPSGAARTSIGPWVAEAARWVPERAPSPAPSEQGAREWILVADDSADMRDYLRRILSPRWAVETVENGARALEVAAQRRPDVIITDAMMPELDGFGLVAGLRAQPALRDLPVLMLSARAGEEARAEGIERGADDYLVKPFSPRELVARVENQLLRSAMRAAATKSARVLDQLFEEAPFSIALLEGSELRYALSNRFDRGVLRCDPRGRAIADVVPHIVGTETERNLRRVLEGATVSDREAATTIVGDDGVPEERFFDAHFQPFRDASGAITGVFATSFEVTDVVRSRRALEAAQEREREARLVAESATRAKDEFLAMLGHELRNPLAPITTALQLMRMRGVSGADKERAVIERQVDHLVRLVDDLLDVSRITRGKITIERAPVELADVVATAIEMASPLLERNRHALEVDVPRGLVVMGDAGRLAQVVSNLLTNAAKYTDAGGHVAVTARRQGEVHVLEVRDDGVGIDPETLPRIFDLFAQERQSLDRSQGGLGLGLAIVKSLVELHGGRVAARSDGRGKGTEMSLALPAADGAAPGATEAPRQAPVPRGPTRILIVDDNVDGAELIAELLSAMGYDTRTAHDGLEALRLGEEAAPDLAIFDIGLPVMDGYELARRFRAHPSLSRARLVALTGYGQPGDRARSAEAGFAAHLVKPIDLPALQAVLTDLMGA